jgi:hypothetical protein
MQRSTGTMVVAAAFVLAACGSTTLTDVWKAPDTARLQFKKVSVVAISNDITWRRTIEDELVRRIRDVQAVASYQFFADGEPRAWEAARERLKAAGFDGLVTFRLAGIDKQQTYVPPVYANRGVGGYWGYAWPAVYSPGYTVTDTLVQVETLVYELGDDKLVWASRSRSFNPANAKDLVNEVVDAVRDEMRKQGLIGSR